MRTRRRSRVSQRDALLKSLLETKPEDLPTTGIELTLLVGWAKDQGYESADMLLKKETKPRRRRR